MSYYFRLFYIIDKIFLKTKEISGTIIKINKKTKIKERRKRN